MWGRVVLLFMLTTCSFASFAEEWYQGSVVLKSKSVLRGEISVRHGYDVIFFRVSDQVSVIPAFKIAFINLFDESLQAQRRFVSLNIGLGASHSFKFFELLVDGEVSILRRELTVWYSLHLDLTDYEYFVLYNDEILELHKFRKKIYPTLLENSEGALESYVKTNQLSAKTLEDILEMTEYYNNYVTTRYQIAKNQVQN